MKDIRSLKDAIEVIHRCKASYGGSKTVKEVFRDQTAWEGEVEIFDLSGSPKAKRCYAWYYTDDNGEKYYTAVLEIPPVDSPESAVKIAIASQSNQ